MRLPKMRYSDRIGKVVQEKFGGYDHNLSAGEGDIYDEKNLSSRHAPLMATRQTRRLERTLDKPNGLYAAEKLAWVDETGFYYDGERKGSVTDGKKRFGSLGDYIIILPDKAYYDTREHEATHTAAEGAASAAGEVYVVQQEDKTYEAYIGGAGQKLKGESYGEIIRVGSAPYKLLYWDGAVWRDVGHKSFGNLESSVTLPSGAWIMDGFIFDEHAEENTIYSDTVDFHDYFRAGDAVEIVGTNDRKNDQTPIIREISEDGHKLRFSEYAFELKDEDGYRSEIDPTEREALLTGVRYVATSAMQDGASWVCDQTTAISATAEGAENAVGKVFVQLTSAEVMEARGEALYTITAATFKGEQLELTLEVAYLQRYQIQTGAMTISRKVPDMDYICSNENRLWGCRNDSIYASKPGDPFNFNVFDGIASDSYAVDSGSPGRFTGCASYMGYPVFFKEHNIYKIYGSIPSNFELMGAATTGVAEGSGGSLAIAGETLFYLGATGVCAYTGSLPAQINEAFGSVRYSEAVGGSDGLKYYVSMKSAGGYRLFVYDTQRGIWHREDDVEAVGFARTTEGAYMLTAGGRLLALERESDETVEWFAEFGDLTDGDPNRKGVSRMQIRMELAKGATFRAEINFDSQKRWDTVMNIVGAREKQSFVLPIIPRRTDHWRLRLSGKGQCVIYSIAREFYKGSDYR